MILISGGGGAGGLSGPAASTDDGIARWDGTAGDTFGEPTSSTYPRIADNGVMTTVGIRADVSGTRDIGQTTTRFGELHATKVTAAPNPGASTLTTGTAAARISAVLFDGSNAAGQTFINNGAGSFATGQVHADGTSTARMEASDFGAVSFGSSYASGTYAATIRSQGFGSFAQGQATAYYGNANIDALGNGTFAQGYAQGYGAGGAQGNALVRANGSGAFAQGHCLALSGAAGGGSSNILALGDGAFAQGSAAVGGTVAVDIRASGDGSFAHGRVQNAAANLADIEATADGAVALGFANASTGAARITASGSGAGAFGSATNAVIEATATNAFQFGVGSNTLADSLQVGNAGIVFKGTSGAPAALADGQFWVNGGSVYVRTNGVTKNLDNI